MGLEIEMQISYHIPIAKLGVRILYYIVRLSVRTFNSLLFWKLQFNETFCEIGSARTIEINKKMIEKMDAILLLFLNKKYHPLTFDFYTIVLWLYSGCFVGVLQYWTTCFSMIILVRGDRSYTWLAQRSCTEWRLVLVLAIAVMPVSLVSP
jgi:hypothetical protein